jgi:hypothetical protein
MQRAIACLPFASAPTPPPTPAVSHRYIQPTRPCARLPEGPTERCYLTGIRFRPDPANSFCSLPLLLSEPSLLRSPSTSIIQLAPVYTDVFRSCRVSLRLLESFSSSFFIPFRLVTCLTQAARARCSRRRYTTHCREASNPPSSISRHSLVQNRPRLPYFQPGSTSLYSVRPSATLARPTDTRLLKTESTFVACRA